MGRTRLVRAMSGEAEYVRWSRNSGQKPVIIRRKRTKIHVCMIEGAGLKVMKVPNAEERHMTPLDGLEKAAKHMRGFGRRRGSTKEARALLRGV